MRTLSNGQDGPAGQALETLVPLATVVSPGADLRRFRPGLLEAKDRTLGIVYIGFFARLSIEKNPGLFLLAAKEVLLYHPFTRFVVIGDGKMRRCLEELASRLQISWAVHFMGMLAGEELVQALAGLHIVVNPSLRAWSETFCIANIEVMAMGIPLVTFGVGGVGEYVELSPQATLDGPFTVADNLVLLNEASPTVMASAVGVLIQNASLRAELGAAGRGTVETYFSVDRQLSQYASLYQQLVNHASSGD